MSTLEKLLRTERALHKRLNSRQIDEDLDEAYEQLRADQKRLRDVTEKRLAVDDHIVSLHDGWVRGFSEKRRGNIWKSRFWTDVIAYGTNAEGAYKEKGYSRVSFEIESRAPARGISGCEIHTFLMNDATEELGFLVHNKKGGMEVVVIPYQNVQMTSGPVRSWGQMRQAERNTGAWEDAQIVITHTDGQTTLPARWHANGYVEVKDQADFEDWGEWAQGLYVKGHPKVSEIYIQKADGQRAAVSANFNRLGNYIQQSTATQKMKA